MTMIDLASLPPPDVVELLDFEAVYQARASQFAALYPDFASMLESDPCVKLLEVITYLEIQLRSRINDAARAVMLASANGSDLEHLSALFGVQRLITDPGNSEAIPPITPIYELDGKLRYRTQLAPEGFSTAGPEGAYRFHALSASGDVADASVNSPTPGQVLVTVLSNDGDGSASPVLISAVFSALSAEKVRPLTDELLVQGASIVNYHIDAELILYNGPSPEPVRMAAMQACTNYVDARHALGHDVTLSGLYAALHQPGVQRVVLAAPLSDIVCQLHEASYCTSINISIAEDTDV